MQLTQPVTAHCMGWSIILLQSASLQRRYIDIVFAILPETIQAEERVQPRTVESLNNIFSYFCVIEKVEEY